MTTSMILDEGTPDPSRWGLPPEARGCAVVATTLVGDAATTGERVTIVLDQTVMAMVRDVHRLSPHVGPITVGPMARWACRGWPEAWPAWGPTWWPLRGESRG